MPGQTWELGISSSSVTQAAFDKLCRARDFCPIPHLQNTALAIHALDLPASERAQLALLLFESVEDERAELWPDALVSELRRRSEELRSGKIKGLTSEDVFGESL